MRSLKLQFYHNAPLILQKLYTLGFSFLLFAAFTPARWGAVPSPQGEQASYQSEPLRLFIAQAQDPAPTTPQATPKPEQDPEQPPAEEKTEFEKLLDKEYGQEPAKAPEKTSWLAQVVKTLFALLFLTGLLYLIWKVMLFKKNLPSQGSEVIQLLHERPIGAGKNLHLVELGGRVLLLSESETGLRLLTEYSDPTQVERIKLDCDKETAREKPDFWIELSKNMTKSLGHVFGGGGSTETNGHFPWENDREKTKKRLESLKSSRTKMYNPDDHE